MKITGRTIGSIDPEYISKTEERLRGRFLPPSAVVPSGRVERARSVGLSGKPEITADEARSHILSAFEKLQLLDAGHADFGADARVLDTLYGLRTALNARCPAADLAKVASDPEVDRVREPLLGYLYRIESAIENHWSRRLGNEPGLDIEGLSRFPHLGDYRRMMDHEIRYLVDRGVGPTRDSRVASVGGGPMPLTAILTHLETGARVTCIDSDRNAADQARRLVSKLGLSDSIQVKHATGESADYTGHTHAMVAAMVPGKPDVARRILSQSPDIVLSVRSVEGLHKILFKATDVAGIKALGVSYLGNNAAGNTFGAAMLVFRRPGDLDAAADGRRAA